MSDKKRKVPKLRFPGFTDAWEQRKLGEMGKVSMCKRVFKSETSEIGEVPFYKIGTFGEVADSYISKDLFEEYRDKYSYPKVGDILISASGSIGRTVVYTGQAEYFQDSNIVWLDHGGKIDNRFLLAFYAVVKWSGIEGSTIKRLYNDNILNTQISLPSLSEQATVGNFFREFDSLISLHQRKLDNVKMLKKSLLQKLFPKDGEKTPELRFPGFTDDWEQRKLGEISDKVTEKNRYGEYKETLTNSAEFGIVSQRDFFDKDISNEENLCGYYIVRPGDFVYNPRISNLAPVGPIKRNKLSLTGVMSPLYYVFRVTDQIDGDFLAVLFSTSIWHRFMKLNGDSGARADRFSIKDTVFKMMPLYVPGYAEQKEIGQAFNSLDSLISLHQRKLDHLKELKKGLLQQMFV